MISSPVALFMVHFKSRDLAERRPFGRFWHLVPPCEGFIIDQDENDTFTAHMALENLSQDVSKIDPYEWVYKVFGGAGEPFRFKIDEILVTSVWRPNFAIAEHYLSSGGRILLAGDAGQCCLSQFKPSVIPDMLSSTSKPPSRRVRNE